MVRPGTASSHLSLQAFDLSEGCGCADTCSSRSGDVLGCSYRLNCDIDDIPNGILGTTLVSSLSSRLRAASVVKPPMIFRVFPMFVMAFT